MSMKEWMLKRIKKAGENIESTLTQIFFLALFGGSVAILALSKKALNFVLQILGTPTPLWATIALIVLCCLYTYVKATKILSRSIQEGQSNKTPPIVRYFPIGNYKWATTIYENDHFDVDKYPFCIKHDLRFIFGRDAKYCPGTEKERCGNKLSTYDEFTIYETAKSIIENKVRKKTY